MGGQQARTRTARAGGGEQLIYLDEVGTPDSSRIWDGAAWREGRVVEFSKEAFRQALLAGAPEPQVLLDKDRMEERQALARDWVLPRALFEQVSVSYRDLAELVGVKTSSIHYYFPSKEKLYISVLQQILNTWLEPIRAIDADQSPEAACSGTV